MRPVLAVALLALAAIPSAAAPPLRASGRYIVDTAGNRVKLAAVNWYGFDEQDYVAAGLDITPLPDLARRIHAFGFNAVRLPWSNEMAETNPAIDPARLAANPALKGLRALDVLDAAVAALAAEGLYVILDNHTSNADWCCSNTDGNGFWYNGQYPESAWIADWQSMARRYADQPMVVGADLRNEPRGPVWGGGDPKRDWRAAAERAGNAILDVNPNLLIIVEGIKYAADLTGVRANPVRLNVDYHLVYSSHDYSWFHNGVSSYAALKSQLDSKWGFLADPDENVPLWVGEFGTCHKLDSCVASTTPADSGFWFSNFARYLQERDLDWAYWAVNGTQASGTTRTLGEEEGFGIFKKNWTDVASPALLNALQAVVPPSATPTIAAGAVVNSATFAKDAPVVPGSLVTVFGASLAGVTASAAAVPLPRALGGAQMQTGNGAAIPLLFASPTQVNLQLPWDLDPAAAPSLKSIVGVLTSAAEPLRLAAVSPAIYTLGGSQGAILIANTSSVAARPSAALPNARPARAGEYLSIFATGLGAVDHPPATGAATPASPIASTTAAVTVTIGGRKCIPIFAGLAPGLVGVYQVNVQIPPTVSPGDAVPLSITAGGVTSNAVAIAIE